VEWLADRLASVPGVTAVALGGSRAQGTERPDSDWDFALYYRDSIDVAAVRSLGFSGTIAAPGEWAYPMNGGAWLTVDGQRVDLLFRDLAEVERWTQQAEAGFWELFRVPSYLCGMASYVLMAEAALGKVLVGEVEQHPFPDLLAERGPSKWWSEADFALDSAEVHASPGETAASVGKVAFALLAAAQARLLRARQWAVNEKGIVERAGLGSFDGLFGAGVRPSEAIAQVRTLVGADRE
jgi:Nucleotidyltransferase domain